MTVTECREAANRPGKFEITSPAVVHLWDAVIMQGCSDGSAAYADMMIDFINKSQIGAEDKEYGCEDRDYYILSDTYGFVTETTEQEFVEFYKLEEEEA